MSPFGLRQGFAIEPSMMPLDTIAAVDCLEGMRDIPDGSVDLVWADLPYNVTHNTWDQAIVPFEPLWEQLNRVCKVDGAMVFTAVQPFSSQLVTSNPEAFRYSAVWYKTRSTTPFLAKIQPLRQHEDILVFYRQQPAYQPQITYNQPRINAVKAGGKLGGTTYGKAKRVATGGNTTRYPCSVLEIPGVRPDDPERIHPSQKPEALIAWFIRTYSMPGDTVLDPVMGSGTTAVASKRLGRHYYGFERDELMAEKARQRVSLVQPQLDYGLEDDQLNDDEFLKKYG